MFKYDYNYNPTNEKEFFHNANIITQYNDIDDDNYHNYYHEIALLLAVQIDQNQVKDDFESYVNNNIVNITNQEAIKYIHNKIRTIRGDQQQ